MRKPGECDSEILTAFLGPQAYRQAFGSRISFEGREATGVIDSSYLHNGQCSRMGLSLSTACHRSLLGEMFR